MVDEGENELRRHLQQPVDPPGGTEMTEAGGGPSVKGMPYLPYYDPESVRSGGEVKMPAGDDGSRQERFQGGSHWRPRESPPIAGGTEPQTAVDIMLRLFTRLNEAERKLMEIGAEAKNLQTLLLGNRQ